MSRATSNATFLMPLIATRASSLRRQVDRRRRTSAKSKDLLDVLELFHSYLNAIVSLARSASVELDSEDYKRSALESILSELGHGAAFFDSYIQRDSEIIPNSLRYEMATVWAETRSGSQPLLLTVGPAQQASTTMYDVSTILFGRLEPDVIDRFLPPRLKNQKPFMMSISSAEATGVAWHPVIAGHELAHHLLADRPMPDMQVYMIEFDATMLVDAHAENRSPTHGGLHQQLQWWLTEVFCDLFAIHRYGPAGFAAIAEYLKSSSTDYFASGYTHPSAYDRIRILYAVARQLSSFKDADIIIGPFRPTTPAASNDEPKDLDRAVIAFIEERALQMYHSIDAWTVLRAYNYSERSRIVDVVARRLAESVPVERNMWWGPADDWVEVSSRDVVNALWLGMMGETRGDIGEVAELSLGYLSFQRSFDGAKHPLAVPVAPVRRNSRSGVVLIQDCEQESSIRLSLRLGDSYLIQEERVADASGSWNDPDADWAALDQNGGALSPRPNIRPTTRMWGEPILLFPGQLLLASSLEYISMPANVMGNVVARSSLARLGLITPTAVAIEPHFRGLVTLELVNMGSNPVALRAGQRLAELYLASPILV